MAQNGKIRSNLAGNLSVARQVFWRPTIGLSGFLHHLLPSKRNDLALMSVSIAGRKAKGFFLDCDDDDLDRFL